MNLSGKLARTLHLTTAEDAVLTMLAVARRMIALAAASSRAFWRLPLAALAIAACGGGADGTPTTVTDVARVTVTAPQVMLATNDTIQLAAVLTDASGQTLTSRTVTWASSDTMIVRVSAAGVVRGILPGVGSISATSEGQTGSIALTVSAPILVQNDFNGLTGSAGALGNDAVMVNPVAFGYGFSFYTSVHALQSMPARRTQLGWGTWIKPNNNWAGPTCPIAGGTGYETIEGGMGAWVGSTFPTSVAKFRINANPDCYRNQVESTGWTFTGGVLPAGKLTLVQLSNRLLIPPDGFVFANPGAQSFFGYGWLALPIIPAYMPPSGIPTGDQNWTLFLRTTNFTGPVAFVAPEAWTAVHATDGSAPRGLDAFPSYVQGAAIEFGTTARFDSQDSAGRKYRRVPRIQFATDANRRAVLLEDLKRYSKDALWTSVAQWVAGGAAPTQINAAGVMTPTYNRKQTVLRTAGEPVVLDGITFAGNYFTNAGGGAAFALEWGGGLEAGVLPEYYKQEGTSWRPIPASQVPRETWLTDQVFAPAARGSFTPLSTSSTSPWTSARWAAGPFTTTLSDGSVVQYVWYKFIDQPAITRLNLSATVLEQLQAWAESVHQNWGTSGPTIAPPSAGNVATLDGAQMVTPPAGLEKGYVPIVIGQQ